MNEWKVSCNYINGKPMYIVYKLRDEKEADHSGNRTYATQYMYDKELAEKTAAQLNKEYMMYTTFDLSPLAYIIPAAAAEMATATGFYYSKAKAENKIKLMKSNGIKPKEEHFGDISQDI